MIKFMLEVDLAVTQIVSAMLKIQMNQHFVRKPPQLMKNNVLEQVEKLEKEIGKMKIYLYVEYFLKLS